MGSLGILNLAGENHRGVRLKQQNPLAGQDSTIDAKIVQLELGRQLAQDLLYTKKASFSDFVVKTLFLRCRINARRSIGAVAAVQVPFGSNDQAAHEDFAAKDEETNLAIEPVGRAKVH